jgi:tetratricopeptide (TPR) repeat protein
VFRGNYFHRSLGTWFKIVVVGLILGLAFVIISDEAVAQKKKGKRKKKNDKNEEHDQAYYDSLKKAYEFELTKFWSFGFENYKNRQYADAAKYFWKVAKMDTIQKFPKVYQYLGQSYFQSGKIDSAQFTFEMGIEKYPDDDHLHRMRGYILAQRELTDEAITEYEEVVRLKPESVDDWRQLATLYVKADRLDEAITAYEKVLELKPDDEEVRKILATLYANLGDVEKAIETKEKALEQDPKNTQLLFELGEAYFRQSEYEKSIEKFQALLALIPDDVRALDYLGNAYQRMEQYSKAITEYKKILKIEPDNKKVLAEISRCYRGLGRFSLARSYAKKALAVDNLYGLGWIALGEVYEASAEKCVAAKDGKIDFNDKLVYELAYLQYKKALRDLEYKTEAERHISYLVGVLPTTEDKFMHKDQKQAEGECYRWIY